MPPPDAHDPVFPGAQAAGAPENGADPYYLLASSALADENDRVLKHAESFAVFDRHGDVRPVGLAEEGIYHEGTRHLSELSLRLDGQMPLLLGSTARRDNSRLAVDMTNPDLSLDGARIPRGTLHLTRVKVLWRGVCHERLTVRSFGKEPIRLPLTFHFDADFVDLFEVRGMRRARRGDHLQPVVEPTSVTLRYRGLDEVVRRTRLTVDPVPKSMTATAAHVLLELPPGRAVTVELAIGCESARRRARPAAFDTAFEASRTTLREALGHTPTISSSNGLFDDWLGRSCADVAMMTTQTSRGSFPYAGVPWFSTPFGRDGIITALQCLWFAPDLARGVLRFLAATQADAVDASRDAQPGKIVHEMRHGEMAACGEIPFGRYYGSHDATPLFVMLAAAYHRQTDDLATVAELWPNVERALAWMDGDGDPDRDGFVEYARQSATGLAHQGWKDSHDSVFHADGSSAAPPIALAEIQGYVYAARRGAADLAAALGQEERAAQLRAEAADLQRRFAEAFWLEDLETYALALDGAKRPCRVRSSNPGHGLLTGIVQPDHATRLARTLMSDASYSGWGVRTIAAGEARYNPMSYHNGSVWPHDTAMIALGLARYGFVADAARITADLFEASRHFDLARLPELFCGFTRRDGEAPTRYPVACSPQAWSAGAVFMLLQACLGMEVDATARTLSFRHAQLPAFLDNLVMRGLRVGDAELDIGFERQELGVGFTVLRRQGDVEVVALK
jgi:glycogen debranching enzyme